MASLVFSTSVFEQLKIIKGTFLLLGQIYDDEINVFSYLPLSDDFDHWTKGLDTKDIFNNFLNETQDVTLFISNGIKSLGFVFSEEKEFFQNLSLLKKITKAINSQFLIFAFQTDLSKFQKFNLQTSKVETIQNKNFQDFQLVEYNLKYFVDIIVPQNGQVNIKDNIQNIKKQIQSSYLMINGIVLFSDKDSLERTSNGQRVQEMNLIQAQGEQEDNLQNQQEVNTVKGFIYPTIVVKQDVKVQQMKKLLIDDIEDIINIKYNCVEEIRFEKEYLQARIIFYLQNNQIPFQDYYPPTFNKTSIEQELQKKLTKLTKMQLESVIVQEHFEKLNLKEIKKQNTNKQQEEQPTDQQNISEVTRRNTKQLIEEDKKIQGETVIEKQSAKESTFYLLLIIILIIVSGIVLKNLK